jgi:uncharacterized protein YkwD
MAAARLRFRLLVALAAAVPTLAGLTLVAPAALATTPTTSEAAADAQAVFQLINRERSWHGRAPLKWSWRLTSAAHSHNLKEARNDTLTHQLPGELALGARITATGYYWSAIGENIGRTQDWSQTGLLTLHKVFYREVAPYDIHRRNILSRTFRHVGIDVYMDATHHTAWLTEDFAAPA